MRKRNAKQAALVPKENKSPVVEEIIEDNSPSEEEFSFRELDSDEEYDDHSEQDDLSDSTDGQESEEEDCDDETDEEEQEDDDENNEDEADDVDSGEEEDEDSEEFSDVEDNLSNVTASLKKLNNLAKSQKVIQNKRSKKKANYSATNEKVSFVRKNEAKQHDSNKAEIVRAKNVIKNGTQVDIENPVASKLSQSQGERDEYASDSSDEEDTRNTVGNVPMKWYDGYDHVGYNWDGKKILKPEKGDQLENFLKRMEDPDFWRTVKDYQTGQDVVLSEADIELITRIQRQRIPDAQFDEYAPWVEWFTSEVMKTPLRKFPEHKRSFLPSKSEAQKVSKLVHALKMGWIKSSAQLRKERAENNANEPQFYMLWKTDDQAEEMRRIHKHIPAPKRFLPGHAESYNPPSEYLFDNRELKEWHKLKSAPWKRKLHFIPQKFDSLRNVPAYPRYTKERFQRCLDLYLCPRAIKMKLTIEPEELVPQLPSPKDLQPFPTTQSIIYKGHTDMVRCMTVEASGQYLATGGDDNTLRVWEISTGRCLRVVQCGGVVRSVAWCPNQNLPLIAVAADDQVLLINSGVGDHLIAKKADKLLEIIPETDSIVSERVKAAVQWQQITETDNPDQWKKGIRIILKHFKIVKQVTWHGKGDYFSTVMPDGQNRSILIHQLSKRKSFIPIGRPRGQVQCVLFHPIKPFFFVATQRHIRIYDLTQQEMIKKLLTGSQWISSMSIHPGGDNLIVGTYDRKLLWFDLDLSTKPYQTLRLHGTGIRGVAYHKRYPLFASGSDDKSLIVCHGMVYNDLLQNPLIVPLKRLCNHETFNDFGILDVMFHPIQPWVFSAGADSTIRLYT